MTKKPSELFERSEAFEECVEREKFEEHSNALLGHFKMQHDEISALKGQLALIYVNLVRHQDKEDLSSVVKKLLEETFPNWQPSSNLSEVK
jgi:hypothetical protein